MPFVNRATGQSFPSAESKSDDEERKRAPPRKEGKTCLSSIRDDSMNREDQNKNVFKNRISSSPRSTIDNLFVRERLSLSLSFSCDKEKKTNAVRYHQYKHTLKASEVSVVFRPSSHV